MRATLTLRTCLAGLLAAAALAAPARAGDLRYFEDAALHAVQFVDANEGWAVGDEGVIWHSIDGGAHWERQPSGVRGSLRSLHFLNPYTGWVAGREELPGGRSGGVLLYTDDGGLHWQRVLLGALPGLNVVRFVDEKTGYAAGDGADLFPSGVFATADSGRTWQPVPGPRATSWLAADFAGDGGALAGAWNRLATLRRGKINALDQDTLGGRSLRGLRLHGDGGVAVGQGGLVLTSPGTRGSTWQFALNLPPSTQAGWDFHAVGGAGSHVWVVGRPGSVALHSPDGGTKWEVVRTGQPLPLNGVFFRDEQHGWAVGELGSVLATADGGKSWQVQRRGGQRAAVLFVHARAAGAPLDTVALLGGEEGYLTAGVRVTSPDAASASPARAAEGPRFSAAVRQAGGAAGEMLWQFPVPSHLTKAGRDELVASWDGLHGKRAAEHLLGQIVLALRVWRPDVVVTDHPDMNVTGSAADALLAEAVREAFRRAGDPEAFPEHLKVLGLEVWKPTKLYARWEGGKDAQVTLDLTAVCDRLGSTAREFAAPPAELLGAPAPPAERSFRFLADRADGASANDHNLMQGVILAPGGLARRALPPVEATAAEVVKAVRQRSALRAMAEAYQPGAPATGVSSPERVLAQIGPMLQDMPDDQAAPAAYGVAQQYVRTGQWGLAREAFLLMTDRYPTHPLTVEAYRWLIRHNSSSEARRRHDLGQFLVVGRLEVGLPHAGQAPPVVGESGRWQSAEHGAGKSDVPLPRGFDPREQGPPKKGPKLPEVPALEAKAIRQVALLGGKPEARQWYQSSLDLGPRLAALGPLFANDPSVQFCLQSARRNLGDFEEPLAWYRQFAARQPDGPWRAAALAELWLANRTGPAPKPTLTCRFTETRPFLDGKLDDLCWKGVAPARLQNAAGTTRDEYATEVRMAYDRDFLYLAVRCSHPAGKEVALAKPRLHDADLRGHDRVSLLLDLDRDYSTCFHLQIDQRGCVCDDCWGDKTWGPRWFVAVHPEPTGWTAEAAIPLTALSGDTVTSGRAWAVNVVRVLPGRGVQAWSLPAEAPEEALRPEGMGLLMFTQSPTGPVAGRDRMPGAQ